MRSLLLLLFVTWAVAEKRALQQGYQAFSTCIDDRDVVETFHSVFDGFVIKLFKAAAHRTAYFVTISPQAVWITLSAIAEGADYTTQKELFALLNLPNDLCSRQKFYQLATSRITPNDHVNIVHSRALVIEETARVNPHWNNVIRQNSLLQVVPAPIKYDPTATTEIIRQLISSNTQNIDLKGNSVILNSMDYNGIWTTAFADAVVQRSPFYGKTGQRIGSVDLMRMRRRVRIGYVPSINLKVIELPIGKNEEYRMLFGIGVDNDPNVEPAVGRLTNSSIFESLSSLQDSLVPIDVAIPRFTINTEIDLKDTLQDMGVVSLWNDYGATRFISTPAAKPSSYIQRVTVTLDNEGVQPAPYEISPYRYYPSYRYSINDNRYWTEFVADRPFIFGLFDAETYTCLLATVYSKPTYPY